MDLSSLFDGPAPGKRKTQLIVFYVLLIMIISQLLNGNAYWKYLLAPWTRPSFNLLYYVFFVVTIIYFVWSMTWIYKSIHVCHDTKK